MSIVLVDYDPAGFECTIDEQYHREYKQSLWVFSNSTNDGPQYIRNNVTLPGGTAPIRIYNHYQSLTEADTGALCKAINPKCLGFCAVNPKTGVDFSAPALWWKVDLIYGYIDPREVSSTGNPADQPPTLKVVGEVFEEVVKKDINGTPILNSAGDPFDPPVTREATKHKIIITQNFTNPNLPNLLAYAGKVNATAWNGWAARTLKVEPFEIGLKYSQFTGADYYPITFTFSEEPDGWDRRVLNCGYNQIVTSGGTGTKQPILVSGSQTAAPCMLDATGAYIPPPYDLSNDVDPSSDTTIGPGDADNPEAAPSTASPVVYLTFETYNTLEFSTAFNFPASLFTGGGD